MHLRSVLARTGLAVLALGTAVGLAGCSTSLSGDTHWADAAAMRSSADGGSVPTLVESDARDIDLRVSQIGSGGTQVRWTSEKGILRSDCAAGAVSGGSRAGASWWPKTVPDEGWRCGWWRVFEQDGTYYAWRDRTTEQPSGS